MGLLGLYRLAFGFWEMRLVAALTLLSAGWVAASGGTVMQLMAAVSCGALGWGAGEYLFHRFVLHLPRPKAQWLQRIHAMLHWQHHQEPDDPRRLFIPMPGVLNLFALWGGLGYAVAGAPAGAGAALGLGAMLLFYESTHLAAHVNYRPRTRWGQAMKRSHRLHHYKNERYWFGVTHPFMDRLAGTWPTHDQVEKSETARTLGVEPGA